MGVHATETSPRRRRRDVGAASCDAPSPTTPDVIVAFGLMLKFGCPSQLPRFVHVFQELGPATLIDDMEVRQKTPDGFQLFAQKLLGNARSALS